jgi:hypothetical protein
VSRSMLLVPNPDPERGGSWQGRHNDAITMPRGFESPIVAIFGALESYARQHARRFESSIAEDSYLGPVWFTMARALLDLLNGETGGLDCGTIDGAVRKLAVELGYTEEL